VADPTPFAEDHQRRAYEPEVARDFWRALVQIERVFARFRTRFTGKTSPIHFFWGSADLAVTRFSGRRAPLHPGGIPNLPDAVTQEAYSHEVSSAGFWAGAPLLFLRLSDARGFRRGRGRARRRPLRQGAGRIHPAL